MGRSVIKIPYFVLTPWPPLSYERGGNPLRNHHDFLGRFRTPFEFPLEGGKRETVLQR